VAYAQDFNVWEDLQLNQKEDRKCQEEGQAWSEMWKDKEISGKETRTITNKHKTKDKWEKQESDATRWSKELYRTTNHNWHKDETGDWLIKLETHVKMKRKHK